MRCWLFVIVFLFSVQIECRGLKNVLTIGAVFHEDEDDLAMAFVYAIQRRNTFFHDIKFRAEIGSVLRSDTFATQKLICNWTQQGDGLAAIFGPTSPKTSCMAQSIAEYLEIPQIQVHWKPSKTTSLSTLNGMTINFWPEQDILAHGIATVARHMDWNNYIIFYEDIDSLIRLQDVLKIVNRKSEPVPIRQLDPGGDYRSTLKEFKDSLIYRIILDCRPEVCFKVLTQAKEIGFLDYVYSYLLTHLDSHTLDIKSLGTKANITAIRIMDPDASSAKQAVRDWQLGEKRHGREVNITAFTMKTELGLMDDAVAHFTETISELHATEPIRTRPLRCDGPDKWDGGIRIASFMKVHPKLKGTTGTATFNPYGSRDNFMLDIVEFVKGVPEKSCEWDPRNMDYLKCSRSESSKMQAILENLQNELIIVSSKTGPPYLVQREKEYTGQNLTGNAQFYGYSLDLIDAIASILNFTYEFRLTKENTYGVYNEKTKSWTGLVRDLLERKAHIAVCDLTITHARRSVVDFSVPFMSLGISILYRKATEGETSVLAFLEPLETEVWLYILTFFVIMTFIQYLLARMAPGDWVNPHPLNKNPPELQNIWTVRNCLWLMLGSTMSCGCYILPKGISSRMGISMWWFLILIITNSYKANLAAFLTKTRMGTEINSAESLSQQTKVKYGTVSGGATQAFFRDAKINKVYMKMWRDMRDAKPSVFEKENADGVKRVLNATDQGYAFLMESSQIEYEVERNCNLKQVGTRLDNKGYGIAMPVNSPYRSAINKAILQLQEDGTLNKLKKKWWNAGNCDSEQSQPPSSNLAFKYANVRGVFYVTTVGMLLALVFTICEFLWNARKLSIKEHLTFYEALVIELRFAVRVWATQKKLEQAASSSIQSAVKSVSKDLEGEQQGSDSLFHLDGFD